MKTPFSSLLIANRGEIALRIMRSARAMGLRCIAVHSDADAAAPHVAYADSAVRIGAGPAGESYLNPERILDAARQSGAQAVHPGYGFLSENGEFAQACIDAGLVFVGPAPSAITMMGNKATAKQVMAAADVPCVPGYDGADQSDATLTAAAAGIGYPVMIKAAAGGGGRGMRLAAQAGDFIAALHLAQSEALSAFGSSQIILEKAIRHPRHVEVQIIGDRYGNLVHLGERDCSVQRRHQKVIEESPSPAMTPDLRARMGAAAITAARAIDYEGAGTVEFLLDAAGDFYFLEMNTRLQVEHPVTELVTGRDLVALQLSVAQGAALGFAQGDVSQTGHAIEARLYAEDAASDFLPCTGDIALWQPGTGAGIRVDDGVRTGQTITPFYDPMLAKIIAHGDTRQQARQRLIAALGDTVLFGATSNRDFLIDILSHPDFAAGQATTGFIADAFGDLSTTGQRLTDNDIALAAALAYRALQQRAAEAAIGIATELLGWGSPGRLMSRMTLGHDGRTYAIALSETGDQALGIHIGDQNFQVTGQGPDMRINGTRADLRACRFDGVDIHIATGTKTFAMAVDPASSHSDAAPGDGTIVAPMHGQLTQVLVQAGDRVRSGTRLAVLEAMKMQHDLLSQVSGTVRAVHARIGSQVRAGDMLIETDTDTSAP